MKMYPERPPQSIIDDPMRFAELRVFQALSNLPERYRVFYSLHWQNDSKETGAYEGEADFIIANPDKGLVVLEVKGGGITFDGTSGKWYSQRKAGNVYEIKDPVEQGRRSHYEIKNRLEKLPGWPARPLNIWHAVCFPDVHLKETKYLKPDLPRQEIIDADDMEDISSVVEQLFKYLFGEKIPSGVPGNDRMQMIEGLLANSFQLRSPLGVDLAREDEKLIDLTEQQFRALALLGSRKRAAIGGCAGSGKTMLAARKAQQFQQLGLNVLLVCFNAALAEDLRSKLPQVNVYTFHDLCRKAANQVGFRLRNARNDEQLFDEILPEALMDASQEIGRVYDAIIVDEGQDFKENYWIALESLLKEDGYLFLFFDNNQNLFGGLGQFVGLIAEEPFTLNQNCRNTKAIHNLVARYHNNPASLLCFSPDGRAPEFIHYKNPEEMQRLLQTQLHKLVIEEHISSEDIVILTPHGESTTKLKPGQKLGLFTLTNQASDNPANIQVTSIQKFKGLERRVVILAEVDDQVPFNYDMLMYVGCSRARTHLVLLESENMPDQEKKDKSKA
jgi:hypothetical protein